MILAPTVNTRIQLCGPTAIDRDGNRLEGRLPGRQGRLLFAYLVLNRHRPIGRDELVEALWPGELPAASDAALNALVSKLRKALGPNVIEGRSSLRLHVPEPCIIDVEAATAAVHQAESRVALGDFKAAWGPALAALFVARREFLPGEEGTWVDEERRQLEEIHVRALETYGAAGLGIGGTEVPAAVRAGRELVRLAPLRESGYRLLMEALARQGNAAEALMVYAKLREVLRDELGVSPCSATQDVYHSLLRA